MIATTHDILSFAWPNRGGWRVFGDDITAGDGGPVPSMAEIEAHRQATEESLAAAQQQASLRRSKLAQLRADWKAFPDFIRGPFRDKFEAASRLLDEGDDAAAMALIEYAEAPASFDADQISTFATVKASMKTAIENL